jgi:hypothetical protein
MRRSSRKRAERMRLIVDSLPYQTRVAMLDGLNRYEIIAGAYSDRSGGVCPMLAAHRCGGRTDFRAFARAWDRFTGACKRSRRATERELTTLAAQLVVSLWREDEARARLTRVEQAEPKARPRWAPSTGALGSAWLIPFRDLEEYHRAIELALGQAESEAIEQSEREAVLA